MERTKEEQQQEREFLVSETARLLEVEKGSKLAGRPDIDEQQLKKLLAERKARRIARIIQAVERIEKAEVAKHNLKQLDEMFPGMSSNSTSKSPTSPKSKRKGGSSITGLAKIKSREKRSSTLDINAPNPRKLNVVKSENIAIPARPTRDESHLLEHDGADHDRTDYTFTLDRLCTSLDDLDVIKGPRFQRHPPNKSPTTSPQKPKRPIESTDYSQADTASRNEDSTSDSSFTGLTDIPPVWQKDCTLTLNRGVRDSQHCLFTSFE